MKTYSGLVNVLMWLRLWMVCSCTFGLSLSYSIATTDICTDIADDDDNDDDGDGGDDDDDDAPLDLGLA